ncbi:CaiB/BaiF CoA transferase family protein [Sinimarinibacterium flocculans]|jgi:crotonobetainyl-CoA:carnitine CoA-transferase CaiB-like acyl-CoA transferase|uniref:CaiB/BaiF CoA transferase family protein n=1 Tax=Sinimarinibacterium flocculans TaxID=985250 RepID=UPI0035155C27
MAWPQGPERPGALRGLKVLDLSRVLGGPYCTQILSDHGADVIKVEPPVGDETRTWGPPFVDRTASYFIGVNRNKRDIALDLSRAEGREIVLRLLSDADVLVENFKTGTMERWGLGYEDVLRGRFPRLIHCRVSGFGADGPLGGAPGYDAVAQAMSGLMSVNGDPASGPTRIGIPIVDMASGLNAVIGILLALNERQRSGAGQFIDISLFDTAVGLQHPHAANWFVNGQLPRLVGSGHPNVVPYDKFATRSGEIFLGIGNDGQFRKFCEFVGAPELATDPRYASNGERNRNRDRLRASIEALLADREAAALCQALLKAGVPAGPVHSLPEVLEHPHTRHRRMVVELGAGQRGLGVPVKLSRTPGQAHAPAPAIGQHTYEVLGALGYAKSEIDALVDAGVAVRTKPAPEAAAAAGSGPVGGAAETL